MKKTENRPLTDTVRAIQWTNNHLKLLDQRLLPGQVVYQELHTVEEVTQAISEMVVRGAPAIGVAAAYGVVLAAANAFQEHPDNWKNITREKLELLGAARPTAVNLRWTIERMAKVLDECGSNPEKQLLNEAVSIHNEDIEANRRTGEIGSEYLRDATAVLTHCNTGALATGGFGTALGVIRTAFSKQATMTVFASETRPWMQGSRLTAWELLQDSIPVTIVADSACAYLMQSGKISWVIVGADRITANGDVANKIGTYTHAINARHHGIGFMVVAPTSTFDLKTKSGKDITIEERSEHELLEYSGVKMGVSGAHAYNPVFDITPAELVSIIVTGKGAIEAPTADKIRQLLH